MKIHRRKRICTVCGYKFFPPLVSQSRTSRRTTCSKECAHKLNVRRRSYWSQEDLQILRDIAESLPPRQLVQVFNNLASKQNRPTRTRNAIYLKCNDLKLSVYPLYNTLTTDRIVSALKIDENKIYRWISRGLKTTRGSHKNAARHYITIEHLRKFARLHPEEFAGVNRDELFMLIEDKDLADQIKEQHPKRIFGAMRVRCLETGEVFPSQAAAAKHFYLYRSALYRAVKYGKAVGGYHFQRVD